MYRLYWFLFIKAIVDMWGHIIHQFSGLILFAEFPELSSDLLVVVFLALIKSGDEIIYIIDSGLKMLNFVDE